MLDIVTENDLCAAQLDPASLGRRVLVCALHPDDDLRDCSLQRTVTQIIA